MCNKKSTFALGTLVALWLVCLANGLAQPAAPSANTPSIEKAQWIQVPGRARDIGMGGGMIWAIGTNDKGGGNYGIWRWKSGVWTSTDGSGVRITVGPQGRAWVVKADGSAWKWDGNNWVALPVNPRAIDIDVSFDGLFIIGQDHELYRLDNISLRWRLVSYCRTKGTRIAAHPNGSLWTRSSDNTKGNIFVFLIDSDECGTIAQSVYDIGIGSNGSVWAIGDDYGVMQFRGQGRFQKVKADGNKPQIRGLGRFQKVEADGNKPQRPANISVGGNGVPWVIDSDGKIWMLRPKYVLPPPTLPGSISFYNESGYSAIYSVSYQVDGGAVQTQTTDNVAGGVGPLGGRRVISIPANATNIIVSGKTISGASIFNPPVAPFRIPPWVCFKTFGPAGSPSYNNDCTGSVSKEDIDKVWQVIGALPLRK